MANIAQSRWLYVGLVVLQTIIFGSGSAITKLAYDSITPLWCQVFRFGLATLVFGVAFGPRIVRQLCAVRLRDWVPAAVCMAVAFLACNVALAFTTATNVGFLVALPVVFTPILASIANRCRYPVAFVPFQVAVVAGLYLLCSNGGSLSFGLGEALALLGAASTAGALVFGAHGLQKLDAISIAGTQIAASFALSIVCAVAMEPMVDVAAVQPIAWGTIAFLALLSTCLTFLLQNLALLALKPSTVSMLLTGEPVFTALFSFVILGETLSAVGMAGAVIIVAATLAATYLEGRQSEASSTEQASEAAISPEPRATRFSLRRFARSRG